MRKIKTILCLFGMSLSLSSCWFQKNTSTQTNTNTETIEVLGSPSISSAYWEWQKNENGEYDVKLYLTYYKSETDTKGIEKSYDVVPTKVTMMANTCTEDGLDRYIATYVVDGVTIQSYKDVVTPKKGHNFVNFCDDGDAHFTVCECGLINRSERIPHTYVDDENEMTETCKYCNHKHFTDEYLKNKISNLKTIIGNLYVPTDITDAINHWETNSLVKTVIDAIEPEDINEFSTSEISKLMSVAYTYRMFLDAGNYHSYKIDSLLIDEYEINDGYVSDPEYGNVRTFNIPKEIPQNKVSITDTEPVTHPTSGIQVDYYATVYNTIEIPYFPEINPIYKEIGFKLYVPVEGLEYRFLGYYSFPEALANKYVYMNQDTVLAKGWNTISFSDFSAFKDVTHIFIEIKNAEGGMPAGDYKLTSIIARNEDASNLPNQISEIPTAENFNFSWFEKVLNAYNLYESLDEKMKSLIADSDKLVDSYNLINNKFSLPFGSSIYLTNSQNLNDPMAFRSINGNSMYEILASNSSVFRGLIKAQDPLPCENETLGFLSYQEGNDAFGINSQTKFSLFNNLWGDYLTLTTIHIEGNWYLHYVPVDMIEDCLVNAAKTIYSASYIRFGISGIPVSSTNTNSVFISTLYSFDTSLI